MVAKVRRRSGSTSKTLCSAWLTITRVPFSVGAPVPVLTWNVKSIKENQTASTKEKLMSFLEKDLKSFQKPRRLAGARLVNVFGHKRCASYNICRGRGECRGVQGYVDRRGGREVR